jgi:hypothetical protein
MQQPSVVVVIKDNNQKKSKNHKEYTLICSNQIINI